MMMTTVKVSIRVKFRRPGLTLPCTVFRTTSGMRTECRENSVVVAVHVENVDVNSSRNVETNCGVRTGLVMCA